jgi:hypothetical protein
MKFLVIMLAIHFIGEMFSNKMKKENKNNSTENNAKVLHPAEFQVRTEY